MMDGWQALWLSGKGDSETNLLGREGNIPNPYMHSQWPWRQVRNHILPERVGQEQASNERGAIHTSCNELDTSLTRHTHGFLLIEVHLCDEHASTFQVAYGDLVCRQGAKHKCVMENISMTIPLNLISSFTCQSLLNSLCALFHILQHRCVKWNPQHVKGNHLSL